jgi:hypothetical protein
VFRAAYLVLGGDDLPQLQLGLRPLALRHDRLGELVPAGEGVGVVAAQHPGAVRDHLAEHPVGHLRLVALQPGAAQLVAQRQHLRPVQVVVVRGTTAHDRVEDVEGRAG